MATLNVVAINNTKISLTAMQFDPSRLRFGPVAYDPADLPQAATGLAMFTYDDGLGRPVKYIVSDTLANTLTYFAAADPTTLSTTVASHTTELGDHETALNDRYLLKSSTEWTWAGGAAKTDTATVAAVGTTDVIVVLPLDTTNGVKGVRASGTTITLTTVDNSADGKKFQILIFTLSGI